MSVRIFGERGDSDLSLRLVGGPSKVSLAAVNEDGDVICYLLSIEEKDGGEHSLTLHSFVSSEHGFSLDKKGRIVPQRESSEEDSRESNADDEREPAITRRVLPWVPGITARPNDVLLEVEPSGIVHVVNSKGKHRPGGYLARFYREGVLRYPHVDCRFGFSSDARHALEASGLKRSESTYLEATAIPGRRLRLERRMDGTLLRGVDEDGNRILGGNIAFFEDDGGLWWHPHVSRNVGIATTDEDGRVIDLR